MPISQSRIVIEQAYSLDRPVLVYIHGRAKGVGEPKKSVEQAVYVDLSRLGVNHRYFVPAKQKGQRHLKTFYSQALIGGAVDLDAISDAQSIDGVDVRSIRKT